MAACPGCGERNPEQARFCHACGTRLAQPGPALATRKTVTVLFCDVTGSTTLGERTDPEQIRRVMSRYYEEARAVLERHGGTVEKFIGDAVVAVFGVPVLHEDDALRALRASVELQEAIERLNVELEATFGLGIAVRIGVSSGEVIAGDATLGDSFASGDAVNVAQRLESAAQAGEILLAESTYRLARDAIRTERLEPLALKGKGEPVSAHRLVSVLPGAPPRARRFDSPMVGRERELALLEGAFARAVRERSCHLFTVLGAAGVGKSRLVREALRGFGDRARVVAGACLPYGEGITFWPALEIVKQATGIVDGDSPGRALARIEEALAGDEAAPLAARRAAALVGLEEEPVAAEEGFWGIRRLLESLSRTKPLVVVFDDVNWAEPTFLDLVEHLAEGIRDGPVLLVCLARPDLLERRPAWGGGKWNATTILLEPLSEDESAVLLENLLGSGVAGDVLRRVHASAEGIPLFVEELVSMLIDGAHLRPSRGGWRLGGDLSEIPVPESIQVLLASRLDQLSAGERRAIERAAIEGAVFHRGAVEALADEELRSQVDRCLAALVRKELVRPHRASFAGEDAFRFRHVLIREAAYDALPKQVRADLHERFAAWLEDVVADERAGEVEELLGYHLEQAYRYRAELTRVDERTRAVALRAGMRLGGAGRRALAKGDLNAAVNLLERAVELVPVEGPGGPELATELGLALRDAGELARAEQVLARAETAARTAGDRRAELAAAVQRIQVDFLADPARTDELLDELETILPELEALGDERALASGWTLVGVGRGLWGGRAEAGERALERALAHARSAGDRREEQNILRELALHAVWGPRPVADALERCHGLLDEAGGDPWLETGPLRCLATLEARLGRFDAARSLLRRARRVHDELRLTGLMPVPLAFAAGEIELLAGDYATAERELRRGLELLDTMGERGYRASIAAFLAQALVGQGRYGEAESYLLQARADAGADDVWTQAVARGTLAVVHAARGEHAQAEPLAREAVALVAGSDSRELGASMLEDLAIVLAAAGRAEEASAAAEQARRSFEEKGNVVASARVRRLLDHPGGAAPATRARDARAP
ncbi:MAG TPA: adenylate/guanylate cyclase domain-containing protein [Gaiellaceae bacterium]|nr:adenylate/guanylate cyclase domain-containing protein [Gaiellaceae bacterium]